MFLVIVILFSFLVKNLVKGTLAANFKFLEMLQIMGADSLELSKSISQSIIKKIIPGSIASLFFVFFLSMMLVNFFGGNFDFFNASFYWEINFKTLVILTIFLTIFMIALLVFLTLYLFNFFENRFFDKL